MVIGPVHCSAPVLLTTTTHRVPTSHTARQKDSDPGDSRSADTHPDQLSTQQKGLDGIKGTVKIKKHDSYTATIHLRLRILEQQVDESIIHPHKRPVSKLKRFHLQAKLGKNSSLQHLHDMRTSLVCLSLVLALNMMSSIISQLLLQESQVE